MIQNTPVPGAVAPGVKSDRVPHGDVFQSFDEVTYVKVAIADLLQARNSAIVQSAFVTQRGVDRFLPTFEKLVQRGIRICAFVQQPEHWLRRRHPELPEDVVSKLAYFEAVIGRLQKAGLHVNVCQKIHEKFIVVDDDILWEGTLNFLSHRDTFERPTRWISRTQVSNAVAKHRLDTCKECWRSLTVSRTFTRAEANVQLTAIAQALLERRKSLRVSQRKLATSVGLNQSHISRFEDQTLNLLSGTLLQLAGSLGLVLMPVPWMLRHAVEALITERLKHLDET